MMWRKPWEDSWVAIPTDAVTYIVYKEGDYYIAKDGMSGKVVSENTSLAPVLQALAELVDAGKGAVISFERDNYVLDSKVAFPAGVYLVGNGATLDVTGLNDFAFTFNENSNGVIEEDKLTGLWGFKVISSTLQLGSAIAYFENISRGVVVRDVVYFNIDMAVEITGASYSALVSNLKGWYSNRAVKLTRFVVNSTSYAPDMTYLSHIELTGKAGLVNTGPAIYVDTEVNNVNTNYLYAEGLQLGFEDHGNYTSVVSSKFQSTNKAMSLSGFATIVHGNAIRLILDSAIGISIDKDEFYGEITNNFFFGYYVDSVKAILSRTNSFDGMIDGNVFHSVGLTGESEFFDGYARYATINNNRIWVLGSNLTGYAINITNDGWDSIVGNLVYTNGNAIHARGYSVIEGNTVFADGTPYYLSGPIYCDQYLYTSLPDTSDANVSKIFLNRPIHYYDGTNYYIAVWDGTTWRKTQLT